MKPPFPFKDIAKQAKLSTATVDRAWHERPGHTAKARLKVLQAIEDLERWMSSHSGRQRPMSVHVVADFTPRFDLEFRDFFESELEQNILHPIIYSYHVEHFGGVSEIDGAIETALSENPDYLFIFAPRFSIGTRNRKNISKSAITVICLTRDDPKLKNSVFCGFNDILDAEKSAYILTNFAKNKQNLVIVAEGSGEPYSNFIAAFAQKVRSCIPEVQVTNVNCEEKDADDWSRIDFENSFFLCFAAPATIPNILTKNAQLPICYVGLFGDEFTTILASAQSAFSLTVPIWHAIPNMCRAVNLDDSHNRFPTVQISRALEFP